MKKIATVLLILAATITVSMAQTFKLIHDESGKELGPFKLKNGTKVTIGTTVFTLTGVDDGKTAAEPVAKEMTDQTPKTVSREVAPAAPGDGTQLAEVDAVTVGIYRDAYNRLRVDLLYKNATSAKQIKWKDDEVTVASRVFVVNETLDNDHRRGMQILSVTNKVTNYMEPVLFPAPATKAQRIIVECTVDTGKRSITASDEVLFAIKM